MLQHAYQLTRNLLQNCMQTEGLCFITSPWLFLVFGVWPFKCFQGKHADSTATLNVYVFVLRDVFLQNCWWCSKPCSSIVTVRTVPSGKIACSGWVDGSWNTTGNKLKCEVVPTESSYSTYSEYHLDQRSIL